MAFFFTAALLLVVASVQAVAIRAPTSLHASLHTWLTSDATGGYAAPSLALGESPLCGTGLFAKESIGSNALIGTLPLGACISAETTLNNPVIGTRAREFVQSFGLSPGVQSILVAALLAEARFCEGEARSVWAPYADSLPWGLDDSRDSLSGHPLVVGVDCTLAEVGGSEERLGGRLEGARRSAAAVHQMLDGRVSEAECLRAYVLVGSRAIDLSPWWRHQVPEPARAGRCDWSLALVPFFDNANHPSMALLATAPDSFGERFRAVQGHPRYGTMRLDADFEAQELRVYSPPDLELRSGDELLNYVRAHSPGVCRAWRANIGPNHPTRRPSAARAPPTHRPRALSLPPCALGVAMLAWLADTLAPPRCPPTVVCVCPTHSTAMQEPLSRRPPRGHVRRPNS